MAIRTPSFWSRQSASTAAGADHLRIHVDQRAVNIKENHSDLVCMLFCLHHFLRLLFFLHFSSLRVSRFTSSRNSPAFSVVLKRAFCPFFFRVPPLFLPRSSGKRIQRKKVFCMSRVKTCGKPFGVPDFVFCREIRFKTKAARKASGKEYGVDSSGKSESLWIWIAQRQYKYGCSAEIAYRFAVCKGNLRFVPIRKPAAYSSFMSRTMTAFCAWRRFSASSKISSACSSKTFSVIS